MNDLRKESDKKSVSWTEIDEGGCGQRIDNFLTKILKGVPKSHIYRILRGGEVRVNKKRVDQTYRLQLGDLVRIPPVRVAEPAQRDYVPALEFPILFEDDALLVVDKPAGVAVHGGSGVSFGVIEQLRSARPQAKFLELVHRLDRETSGVLLLAKKRSALTALHEQMRAGKTDKRYLTLVAGQWKNAKQHVKLPLHKFTRPDGERRVMVREDGQESHTVFALQRSWPDFSNLDSETSLDSKVRLGGDKGARQTVQVARPGANAEANTVSPMKRGWSLLEAQLKTGRTHQIRVHLAHLGFPIAGDDKYGDFPLNKSLAKQGLKRMFLHAHAIALTHPFTGEPLRFSAPLPKELKKFIDGLDAGASSAK